MSYLYRTTATVTRPVYNCHLRGRVSFTSYNETCICVIDKINEKEFILYVIDLYLHVSVKFTLDLEIMNSIEEIAPKDSHDLVC